tara:strand:- start:354 stop:1049 length:696 start_codon:yes stop_codon:yes gene_type:complete
MEEILSSIRRIISDDSEDSSSDEEVKAVEPEEEKPPVEAVVEPEAEVEAEPEAEVEAVEEVVEAIEDEDDDIFELTNVVEIDDPTPEETSVLDQPDMADFGVGVADSGADIEDDIEFVSVGTDEPETLELPVPEPEPEPEPQPEPVFEAETPVETEIADRLVSDGVGIAAGASFGDLANTLLSRGNNATTVEELVQEMLRPLLKNWLDANLPGLVEKMVSEEIERIARRGR